MKTIREYPFPASAHGQARALELELPVGAQLLRVDYVGITAGIPRSTIDRREAQGLTLFAMVDNAVKAERKRTIVVLFTGDEVAPGKTPLFINSFVHGALPLHAFEVL